MAYTPELSQESSATLRRLAWALKVPMTIAMEMVFNHIPTIVDNTKVCDGCRDKSICGDCAFGKGIS